MGNWICTTLQKQNRLTVLPAPQLFSFQHLSPAAGESDWRPLRSLGLLVPSPRAGLFISVLIERLPKETLPVDAEETLGDAEETLGGTSTMMDLFSRLFLWLILLFLHNQTFID